MKKVYDFLEKVFNDEVTVEDYYWHFILFFSSLFLAGLSILEIFYKDYFLYKDIIRSVEIFFGSLFLLELVLRSFFVYIPNSVYFNWYMILNGFIIISLLTPSFFGNLAILKIIKSLKIIKLYKLQKETRKMKEALNK